MRQYTVTVRQTIEVWHDVHVNANSPGEASALVQTKAEDGVYDAELANLDPEIDYEVTQVK